MCGGFVGHLAGELDPTGFIKKNDWYAKKKRDAEGAMRAQTEADAKAKADDVKQEVDNNQVLQAEQVANRRRKAAQSLLAKGGPGKVDPYDASGASQLARGQAYGQRSTSASLG